MLFWADSCAYWLVLRPAPARSQKATLLIPVLPPVATIRVEPARAAVPVRAWVARALAAADRGRCWRHGRIIDVDGR